ncbi:uncharacterized protein F4807DRAFT_470341 [Annulohypoxylon truncatum]|uniref:uncharacterized protein n=1 Tax=Annulohypoxylon truncatum TaxID=327061 RepID=UPI0020077992|nr:uncharacterized protein F4807DRAFT_470341 [Annulohypoxylon truncatum]KAI1206125.1 hypothetical protein F4807DRAFT_470341 [Annulohypoxylon truncatum]
MQHTPTGWRGIGNGGFAPIPQIDTPDEDGNGDQQQRKVTREEFSSQIRQVLQRSALEQEQDPDHRSLQGSIHSSPAFSDTTLVGGDYLDVPIRHYDEVDLGDFVEYHGYYGPEVVRHSPSPSIKASVGLEVCAKPVPSSLSCEGLYVDDLSNDLSYRGSEGKIEGEVSFDIPNYRPPVLRRRFLLILFLILLILVGLAELAIQLLPSDSGTASPSQVPNSTIEIRPRSPFTGKIGLYSPMELFKRQNNTSPNNPAPDTTTSVTSSTETVPVTESTTTGNGITTESPLSSTSTSSTITSLPGEDVSTDTTEAPAPSTTVSVPVITSSAETSSSSSSSTPLIDPPLPPISITPPLPPLASPTTVSQAEPPPPPPHSPTPVDNLPPPPPAETSSSDSPPSSSFTLPVSLPGHQEPSSTVRTFPGHQESTSIVGTLPGQQDSTTITGTLPGHQESTSMVGTLPGHQEPTPTGDPNGPSATFTLPTWSTGPNDPPSSTSLPDPPNPGPTHPDPPPTDPTETFPTETLPTWVPPTLSSTILTLPTENLPTRPFPGGSGPDSSTTSSTTLPFSSSVDPSGTTTDPPKATTHPHTSTSIIETSSTSTSLPENEPSSTRPGSPTEPLISAKQSFSSTSKSTSMSSTFNIAMATNPIYTSVPPSIPEPIATITVPPDARPPPPPITTTITTSVSHLSGILIATTFVSIIDYGVKEHVDPLTNLVTVYTGADGKSTTRTILAQMSSHSGSVFLWPPSRTVLTDYQGRATKTVDYYISMTTQVLRDKNGHPTATRTSSIKETVSLVTHFDSNGVATETETELVPMSSTITTLVTIPTLTVSPSSKENKTLHLIPISNGKYFLGLMFPTFVAILVSIPIRIIDHTAKLYQPFHALVSSRGVKPGAKACDTLCFPTASTWSLKARVRSLLNGQALLTLTGLLVLGSVIMIPLSSEAIGIILENPDCATTKGDTLTCSMALGVYTARAQIAVALLAFMVILVGLVIVVLRKWNTGVKENPWSLICMVHLAANNEIKTLVQRRLREKNGQISNCQLNKAFKGISFVLNYWEDNGDLKYSILIPNEAHSLKKAGKPRKDKVSRHQTKGNTMPFFILTWAGRLMFLALLCAVEIGLLVYTITGDGQGYVQFMMGRWRVVRFIFTFVGVIISLIWDIFFQAVAFLSPHKLFHRIRLYHGDAGKMTPPTDAFSGIRSSLTPGRRDVYLGIVSVTSILSEILPLLLSIALDKCTETFWAHTVCLWMAVSLLSVMIFTVAGSFFVSWPHMPIDPSIIAGGIYYALTRYMPMSPSSGLLFGRASPGIV